MNKNHLTMNHLTLFLAATVQALLVLLVVPAQGEEILILNPGKRVPAGMIDNEGTERWRTLSYETGEFSGTMLAEGGGPGIPDVAIPLQAEGPYRIHLGLFSGYYTRPEIRVRLSGEEEFQTLSLKQTLPDSVHELAQYIYEVPWKEHDLTGQNLVLRSNQDPNLMPGALAWIRLEPVGETSSEPVKYPPLALTSDGWGAFRHNEHERPEDLYREFENYPEDGRVQLLIWGNGVGDWCNYPTKVGTYFSTPHPLVSKRLKLQQQNIRLWQEKGWDSLQVMRDYTRRRGWEFQVYIRLQGFGVLYPRGLQVRSRFFDEHPEYHCRDREGNRVSRLSYAVPEARDHMLALIREIAGYAPDGICLNFIRGLPLALYEPIMVEGFRERHGIDPRELPEDDARWRAYQAEITTDFVRRAGEVLPEGMKLSAIVPGNRADCAAYGADVATWVREGLVDDLIVAGTSYNEHDVHIEDNASLEFDHFANLERRENIRLMPLTYPWREFETDFKRWMDRHHQWSLSGADLLNVWDGDYEDRFKKIRIVEDITTFRNPSFRRVKLEKLQGFAVSRYHYFEGI